MEVDAPVQFSEVDDAGLDGPERDARRVLHALGFKADKVATTSDKTADFSVEGDTPAYLVEVKSRLLDERLKLAGPGLSEPITKSMRHDAKVGDWLAHSKQQFRGIDPGHERLWFLWCSMESPLGASAKSSEPSPSSTASRRP